MTDFQRSHAELRAALIMAGKEIRRLNFGAISQGPPDVCLDPARDVHDGFAHGAPVLV
jgi:hypothetical protein